MKMPNLALRNWCARGLTAASIASLFVFLLLTAEMVAAADTPQQPRTISGVVVAIQHLESANGVGRVRVTLRLADGRGLNFAEWEGLWRQGDRFRVGQAVALELYPESELGLSSGREWPLPGAQRDAQGDETCGPGQPRCPAARRPRPARRVPWFRVCARPGNRPCPVTRAESR